MKKLLCTVLACATALSLLAGCSGGAASSAAPGSSGGAAPSGGGGAKTTISFWHTWQGLEAQKFKEIIDTFGEAHPDIAVEVLDSTTEEKQLIAMTSGDPFDVGLTMDYTANKWAASGALADMTPYIGQAGTDLSNFVQPELELGKLDGKQYGLPFTMDTFMLFYNKDILKEAGYDEPPRTMEEFAKMCEAVTQTDANGDYTRLGCVPNYPWINPPTWPYAYGASFYDAAANKVTTDTPEMIASFTIRQNLFTGFYDNAKVQKFKSGFGQYQSAENPFFQGKLAFSVEGEWFPTFIQEYAPDLNWGVAPMPCPEGKQDASYSALQAGMLVIPEGSKQKEAAYTFIDWLCGDGPQVAVCVAKGNLPSTASGLKDPKLLEGAPSLEPFIQVAAGGKVLALPAVPFMGEYSVELKTIEERLYNLELTPEEAMKQIAEKIQPLADKG